MLPQASPEGTFDQNLFSICTNNHAKLASCVQAQFCNVQNILASVQHNTEERA